jgi:hypothetical protein
MKKLANLIALFILVSINVLTPISYAQDTQELVENLPEILEDGTPSLINMVVDTVDDFSEELEESGDANEGFVMPSR